MDKDIELQIKIFIGQELEKGTSLSDIQTLINEKFNQRMTYMDVRIMASTLDVDWRSLDPNAKKEEAVEEDAAVEEAAEEVSETAPAGTVVEVSPIARPGMMFSGSVKFASGSSAEWYVDNTGRLGLENLVGDKPNENDVKEFQIELDKAIRKMMGQ
jgi:hypothetical protein